MKLNVFGRDVEISKDSKGAWVAYYLGNEGKKRLAQDIIIPKQLAESELIEYVADLCHEWASEKYPNVTRVDQN